LLGVSDCDGGIEGVADASLEPAGLLDVPGCMLGEPLIPLPLLGALLPDDDGGCCPEALDEPDALLPDDCVCDSFLAWATAMSCVALASFSHVFFASLT